MYNKSKSFKEFERKINEYNTFENELGFENELDFENDWGFYIDVDNNKVLKNKITNKIKNKNNDTNNNNHFCSKYSTIISITLFTIIIIIII